jgi:hypothetical protein
MLGQYNDLFVGLLGHLECDYTVYTGIMTCHRVLASADRVASIVFEALLGVPVDLRFIELGVGVGHWCGRRRTQGASGYTPSSGSIGTSTSDKRAARLC